MNVDVITLTKHESMSYWNGELDGSDFAFDAIGTTILQIVKRLEQEADLVLEKQHPEQSMLSLMKILSLLMDEYPKCVSIHFHKRRYLAVKDKYAQWAESFAKIPKSHVADFHANAESLFAELDHKLKIGGANA